MKASSSSSVLGSKSSTTLETGITSCQSVNGTTSRVIWVLLAASAALLAVGIVLLVSPGCRVAGAAAVCASAALNVAAAALNVREAKRALEELRSPRRRF